MLVWHFGITADPQSERFPMRNDHHELEETVTRLQAQMPQAQTGGGGGGAPAVSREHLSQLVAAAADHADETEGPSSALTPEQKKARWAKIFGFIQKLLPIILAVAGGAGAQTGQPGGAAPG
jgi:hypothetical protein